MSGRSPAANLKFWITCSRGFGGALIFSLPLIPNDPRQGDLRLEVSGYSLP